MLLSVALLQNKYVGYKVIQVRVAEIQDVREDKRKLVIYFVCAGEAAENNVGCCTFGTKGLEKSRQFFFFRRRSPQRGPSERRIQTRNDMPS